MGQEQSAHASREQHARHRATEHREHRDCRDHRDYRDPRDQREHRKRLSRHRSSSDLDFKSDNSSTESSGYRSGSNSAYDYRSASERSDYCHLSLYKNDHYRDINRELYKPVKLSKDKRHRPFLDAEKDTGQYLDKHLCIKSYLSDTDTLKSGASVTDAKKSGIRNYTPKILEEEQKKIDNWI